MGSLERRVLAMGIGILAVTSWAVATDLRRAGGRRPLWPVRLDCTANAARCPDLVPVGDAEDRIPGYGRSPFRGFADPTMRRDPTTGRLWMAYSWPHVEVVESAGEGASPRLFAVVDIHLAHSDDGGMTWEFDGPMWTSEAEPDRGGRGGNGFSGHEVASLAVRDDDGALSWIGARLRYHVPDSGAFLDRRGDSFHLAISRAPSPSGLAGAGEARLGGSLTAPGWQVDTNLSLLDPDVSECAIWNEPALHVEDETLYLAAVCLVFDLGTGDRRPEREKIALFATRPDGEPSAWTWRYVGLLAGRTEAAELGAETLTQVDLVRSRDGSLLALVTPNDWDVELQADIHHGLRVLELVSLEPPFLRRRASGALAVRVSITASDLDEYGPAASGYDPASASGVVFVRRVFDTERDEMVWSLHRTFIHP